MIQREKIERDEFVSLMPNPTIVEFKKQLQEMGKVLIDKNGIKNSKERIDGLLKDIKSIDNPRLNKFNSLEQFILGKNPLVIHVDYTAKSSYPYLALFNERPRINYTKSPVNPAFKHTPAGRNYGDWILHIGLEGMGETYNWNRTGIETREINYPLSLSELDCLKIDRDMLIIPDTTQNVYIGSSQQLIDKFHQNAVYQKEQQEKLMRRAPLIWQAV